MAINTQIDWTALRQDSRLEITYLNAAGQSVPWGQANAVRRRVLDPQGRIVKERIRTVIPRKIS